MTARPAASQKSTGSFLGRRDFWLVPASAAAFVAVIVLLTRAAPYAFVLHFNPYALISLIGVALNLTLLVILVRRPNHTEPILWLTLFIVFAMFWGAAEAMERLAVTPMGSSFWGDMIAGVTPQVAAFLYLFVRGYTARSKTRGLLTPILLISTSAAIGLLLANTSFTPVPTLADLHPWGYTGSSSGSLVIVGWVAVIIIIALVRLFHFYRISTTTRDRRQAAIFIVAISALLFVSVISESILPNMGVLWFPPLGVFTNALVSLSVIIGIYKYGSLSVSPADIAGTVLGSMAGGVLVTDINYSIQYANNRAAELFDTQVKTLGEGDLLSELHIYTTQRSELEAKITSQDVIEIPGFEFSKNGQSIMLDIRITKLPSERTGYVFVLNDVTELKRSNDILAAQTRELETANKAFKDSQIAMINLLEDARELEADLKHEKAGVERKVEQRTREVGAERARLVASINSLAVGFFLVDTKLKIVDMNRAAGVVLSRTNRGPGMNKQQAQKLIDNNQDFMSKLNDCIQKRTSFTYEEAAYTGEKILKVYIAPIIDREADKQPVLGLVVVAEDISEAKATERSRDEFFSIASHELRTPLTAIRGNTAMIMDYYAKQLKDPSLKEMIVDIHDSSTRLITIVNDFLNTSRLEQGKIQFKLTAFSGGELIEEVIKEFKAGDADIKVPIVASVTSVPDVYADRDRLKEVIINLLANAVKFTESGKITVGLAAEKNRVKMSVSDTGKGIPADSKVLLFRKFQQASNNILTRDSTRSTGLGLYISKLIVNGMGGEILLESSEPSKGSTFAVYIPTTNLKADGEKL